MTTLESYGTLFDRIRREIGNVIIGQEEMIDLMITTLLAKGHILLEGVPGLAKSLAVETYARVIGGDFRRFQFTPDKMPSDITGTMIYNEKEKRFDYYFGPVFCNVFLADEINRASPKVQSALLQAMQERKVDVERLRYDLPDPFIVLATQNPIEQIGTYPLAEAQVDRFMVKYDVRYPPRNEEAELLARKHTDFEDRKADVSAVVTPQDILSMQQLIHERVRVSQRVMAYILDLCAATRPPATYGENRNSLDIYEFIRLGASPRATEFLLALSKAHAGCHGRDWVTFEDVNRCAVNVLRHRILLTSQAMAQNVSADLVVQKILQAVAPY